MAIRSQNPLSLRFTTALTFGHVAQLTGAQLALRHSQIENQQSPIPAAKCLFTLQREMITKLWDAEGPTKPVQGTLF